MCVCVSLSYQPGPVDDLVKLEGDEDELQDVDRAQHLQLRENEIVRGGGREEEVRLGCG